MCHILLLSAPHGCPTATSWDCPITHSQVGDLGTGVSNRNDHYCLMLGKGDFSLPRRGSCSQKDCYVKRLETPGDLEAETGGSQLAPRAESLLPLSEMSAWSTNNT